MASSQNVSDHIHAWYFSMRPFILGLGQSRHTEADFFPNFLLWSSTNVLSHWLGTSFKRYASSRRLEILPFLEYTFLFGPYCHLDLCYLWPMAWPADSAKAPCSCCHSKAHRPPRRPWGLWCRQPEGLTWWVAVAMAWVGGIGTTVGCGVFQQQHLLLFVSLCFHWRGTGSSLGGWWLGPLGRNQPCTRGIAWLPSRPLGFGSELCYSCW